MSGNALAGMLIIDKPAGMTSHDVVVRVRKQLGVRAGHTGTLDPQATGVLLVCVGAATRLTRFLQHQDKVYDCSVRLGTATDTYDADGEVVEGPVEVAPLDERTVKAALEPFRGPIEQVPPVYSAKKIRGQPAYKRARRGEEVVHEPIQVQIHALELLATEGERIDLRVHCGSGTYVRTLASDLGRALGYPAHLEALRRLEVGGFGLDRAMSWEWLEGASREQLSAALVPCVEMLPAWPVARVGDDGLTLLRNGGVIEPRHIVERAAGAGGAVITGTGTGNDAWVRVLDPEGVMVAAAEVRPGGMLQPRVVLR